LSQSPARLIPLHLACVYDG